MALSPRTLVNNPAAAAVAAVTIFGLTVMATSLNSKVQDCKRSSETPSYVYEVPCASVADQLGDRATWSELEWLTYVACFEARNDSRMLVGVTSEALLHYPQSETFWNIKAYHQMVLGDYRAAGHTLRAGMRIIEPTTGTMENNLAWASLWTGDMTNAEMRLLYASSLEREPRLCETLHTGLMVEYKIAAETSSYERAEALKRIERLRQRYERCDRRSVSSPWDLMVEQAGAALVFEGYEDMLYGSHLNEDTRLQFRQLEHQWTRSFPGASVDAMCSEAIPATLDIDCEREFQRHVLRR